MSESVDLAPVRAFLAGLIQDDEVELADDEPIFTGGWLDSLSVLKLMGFLEDHYGITIPATAVTLADFDDLLRIGATVARFRAAAGAP